jgi:hypothetical protein
MSEANTPSNDQDLQYPSSSSVSDWFSGWEGFSVDAGDAGEVEGTSPKEAVVEQQDWQTVNFPNAISVDAIERQSLYTPDPAQSNWRMQATPNPSVNSPVRVEDIPELGSQPSLDDLISLIQELNQCNSALLDRVSQLEEALEQSQNNLQIEHPPHHVSQVNSSPDLVAAYEQTTKLLNQLEFAQQTNKRQQILIDTLQDQFDSSQERVAQLERECAHLQQRYNEQSQRLSHSESKCRDLRARLQRQQRYTMQYKAALEKCLEVPPPSYESPSERSDRTLISIPSWYEPQANLSQVLLPKAQHIQPWSSQSQSKFLENLTALTDDSPSLNPLPEVENQQGISNNSLGRAIANPDLPPVIQFPIQSPLIKPGASGESHVADPTNLLPDPHTPISYDLKPNSTPPANQSLESGQPNQLYTSLPPEVIQAGVAELQSAIGNFWEQQSLELDSEAEAAMWQDLARLIDVSAEDVMKASLAKDFATFETINSDAEPAHVAMTTSSTSTPEADTITKVEESASAKVQQDPQTPASTTFSSESSAQLNVPPPPSESSKELSSPFAINPSWPSPLVHPLRPLKKLQSLSAVELPKFAH